MTDIEKALLLWRRCADMSHVLDTSGRAQIANMFHLMIHKAKEFDAFKQEVSDAVEEWTPGTKDQVLYLSYGATFARFIIPKPVDPLVEVMNEISGEGGCENMDFYAYRIREGLAARGLKIVEDEQ